MISPTAAGVPKDQSFKSTRLPQSYTAAWGCISFLPGPESFRDTNDKKKIENLESKAAI